ncbi:MAG: ABC transporter permease [Lachnospiraceae bacterium]|nr:ABC transporter permease [Lachnospiraceae bacterium]
MRNPLSKRLPRELRSDWKKYVVLFLLLTITIGFVSGMFVANDSMLYAANASIENNQLEDGHFELKSKPTTKLLDAMEASCDIHIYQQFYKDVAEESDTTIRVFMPREDCNFVELMQGAWPAADNEIVIDRMHADNRGIAVGDAIRVDGRNMKVTGLVAFSDYSTLYKDATDIMFDAITFDVGITTKEGFEAISGKTHYQYAFRYNTRPQDSYQEKEWSDENVKKLAILALTGSLFDNEDDAEEFKDETDELKELKKLGDRAKELQAEIEANPLLMMDPDVLGELQDIQDKVDASTLDVDKLKDQVEIYDDNKNELTDYLPNYVNEAIHFAPDDMSQDKVMGQVLLYVLIAVLAFIFAIAQSATITKDAAVIGTLRSSGYTRGELARHYLMLPTAVTLFAAIIGNVLGYTVFKNVVVAMYYNSYSLPTYETKWNMDALWSTTLIPVVLVFCVNVIVIVRKLHIEPLRFLRRDLSTSKRKKAMRLPRWKFLSRFRLRVLFSNMMNYFVLLIGICFVMVLLGFAVGLPATLKHYQNEAPNLVVANYQYVLTDYEDKDKDLITTNTKNAEIYGMTSLKTVDGVHVGEEISVYGYTNNSKYFVLPDDVKEGEVFVSTNYADKFGLKAGDEITLAEKFEDKQYTFTINKVSNLSGSLAVYMPLANYREVFDTEEDYYTGFFSDKEITDIDEKYIATVITSEDLLTVVHQLDHSMGGYMDYFAVACDLMAALLIYLLTKIIIEKNATSISMLKVLGYHNSEVNSLYIRMTTVVVVVSSFVGVAVSNLVLQTMWRNIMYQMSGWFEYIIGPKDAAKMIIGVIVAYILVSFFDMRRVKRIPLTEALKNVE